MTTQTPESTLHAKGVERVSLVLRGDVQGLGIRPTIARLAQALKLAGTVHNSCLGVEVAVQGCRTSIDRFQSQLAATVPTAQLSQLCGPSAPRTDQPGFSIISSDVEGTALGTIPLDRAICDLCIQEILTPSDRRYGYALNSCSQCGPRFSILTGMPYDRCRTSLAAFSMCAACEREYREPSHRRFHAQTNCCPDCGPNIWFSAPSAPKVAGTQALAMCAQAIHDGQIVAIKGIGGYQLLCDATNAACVQRLRALKGRLNKPFAVMVRSVEVAHQLAVLDSLEEAALQSPAGPIVIANSKPLTSLAEGIHPSLSQVGMMLPTSAMHVLLLDRLKRPLVVTSGNLEGDPLEYQVSQAERRLSRIADAFLHHDRRIEHPVDDSVVRCMAGQQVTLRAARGLAPMVFPRLSATTPLLAVGGEQKAAIALANGQLFYLGPHVGEMESLAVRHRFEEQHTALAKLLRTAPQQVACDLHPDYFSGQYAQRNSPAKVWQTQHHHAHVVAGMAEHGWLDQQVLGFAFDGAGAGIDRQTLWGGEVMLATSRSFERVAHLRPFLLAGGAMAMREPWRVAVALLTEIGLNAQQIGSLLRQPYEKVRVIQQLIDGQHETLVIATTSMGRLFDGVAAIVCGASASSFEGEAAMRLESACDIRELDSYVAGTSHVAPKQLDWRPVIVAIVEDLLRGLDRGIIAMRFHRAIAGWMLGIALDYPSHPVVLSGGVFQNRILVELVATLFRKSRTHRLGLPGRIPPNDGGLAIGQLHIAQAQMELDPCA